MIKNNFAIILILFCFLNSANAQESSFNEILFPKPNGPYQVGTTNYFWIDENRGEIFTKDTTDRRHILVQVWYPAQMLNNDIYSNYILNPDEFGKPTPLIKLMMSVKTNSILNTAIVSEKNQFPVVLFSHGMGMSRFSCTFLMENLASNGYVVFSIGHSFFDGTVEYPDGYKPEQDFFPENEISNLKSESNKGSIHYTLEALKKDTEFVLTQITKLNESPSDIFHNRLDLVKIGISGWSIGGINAAQLCKDDNRFTAGINFDGLVGGDVVEDGIDKAFMIMKNGSTMPENMLVYENSFLKNSSNDIYRITISGTVHTNFSDMALFNSKMEGNIDTKLSFEIICNISLNFFNKYILDTKSLSIEKICKQYPEVNFEKFQTNSK